MNFQAFCGCNLPFLEGSHSGPLIPHSPGLHHNGLCQVTPAPSRLPFSSLPIEGTGNIPEDGGALSWIVPQDAAKCLRRANPTQQPPNLPGVICTITILNPNPAKKKFPIPVKSSTAASTPCPCSSHSWTPPEGFCEGQRQNSYYNPQNEQAFPSHHL